MFARPPAFPVDAHVGRVLERLGLFRALGIDLEGTDHKAKQRLLWNAVPPALRYSLHVNLLVHGRVELPASETRAVRTCVIRDACASSTRIPRRGSVKPEPPSRLTRLPPRSRRSCNPWPVRHPSNQSGPRSPTIAASTSPSADIRWHPTPLISRGFAVGTQRARARPRSICSAAPAASASACAMPGSRFCSGRTGMHARSRPTRPTSAGLGYVGDLSDPASFSIISMAGGSARSTWSPAACRASRSPAPAGR